ncbi:hypothetical protein OIU84_028149, partial [Salix udensis]
MTCSKYDLASWIQGLTDTLVYHVCQVKEPIIVAFIHFYLSI